MSTNPSTTPPEKVGANTTSQYVVTVPFDNRCAACRIVCPANTAASSGAIASWLSGISSCKVRPGVT